MSHLKQVYTFASNLRGAHGAGSALHAVRNFGAICGQAEGLQGESYAIPTKDYKINTMPLDKIEVHVNRFIQFAKDHPEMHFNVVAIGCGLAGYTPSDIAPMFRACHGMTNCSLPLEFTSIIEDIVGKEKVATTWREHNQPSATLRSS